MVTAPLLITTELSDLIPLALEESDVLPAPDAVDSFVICEASLSVVDICLPLPPQLPQPPLTSPPFLVLALELPPPVAMVKEPLSICMIPLASMPSVPAVILKEPSAM